MTEPTHYLPAFTSLRQRVQLAVCGRAINPEQHSTEPTCPKCHAWLEADEAEARSLAAQWDAEDAAKLAADLARKAARHV